MHKKTHNQADALTPKNPVYRDWIFWCAMGQLKKDLGRGDVTTDTLFQNEKATAIIFSKQAGILAGVQEIGYFSAKADKFKIKFYKKDGAAIKRGEKICAIEGKVSDILKMERIILNLMGRMSGIATATSKIVKKVKLIDPNILVAPTRKTLWGLLDKRACVIGGAGTHRLSLDNAVLIKDNHMDALGGDAFLAIKKFVGRQKSVKFIEIEAQNFHTAVAAAKSFNKFGINGFIMLDNFSPKNVKKTIKALKKSGLRGKIGIEVSGGITPLNVAQYAKTGADIISMGGLTHSAPMLDLSLRFQTPIKCR